MTPSAPSPALAPASSPAPSSPRLDEVQQHNVQALLAEHRPAVLAYAEKLLGDRHAAEDVVQEVLIRAWHHIDRLMYRSGSVRGWLITVTRNLIIDRLRSAASRHELVGAEDTDIAQRDHADAVVASIETTALMRRLPLEHREVLFHTYLCGRTVRETAQLMGVPAGTVKSRQHYALTRLRQRFHGDSPAVDPRTPA
ncbi:sigma-70 family RNA polymerase sigma factor [Streptomyces sp. NPDC127119]|uniref:sigma-70 family RNA polymerase sigma factor n=1 Tax=Streptomyces sp. NPDC127119 TaxID=3345370 RepID=UPI00363AE000